MAMEKKKKLEEMEAKIKANRAEVLAMHNQSLVRLNSIRNLHRDLEMQMERKVQDQAITAAFIKFVLSKPNNGPKCLAQSETALKVRYFLLENLLFTFKKLFFW